MRSWRDVAFLAFSVVALALLVSLGLWQVDRLEWKEDLIARMSQRMAAEPRPLGDIAARHGAGEDVEFMRAAATGRFAHDGELFVFANHRGVMGWRLVTPLHTTDGSTVLVDRGFIPYELKDPAARPGSRPEGTVTITGAVRTHPRAPFTPDNDPHANVWHWWEVSAMAEAAGVERVEPFVLQAEPQPGDAAWPQAFHLDPAALPNRHLGYAATWFGLAAMLLVVNALYLFRRRGAGEPG